VQESNPTEIRISFWDYLRVVMLRLAAPEEVRALQVLPQLSVVEVLAVVHLQ